MRASTSPEGGPDWNHQRSGHTELIQYTVSSTFLFRWNQAHSKALREAASKLQANGFDRHLRPLKGKVDVDLAALAAKVVERVVERSEASPVLQAVPDSCRIACDFENLPLQ